MVLVLYLTVRLFRKSWNSSMVMTAIFNGPSQCAASVPDLKRLLEDLNVYSGYLVARGYKEDSIKFHLANMANRSRENLLVGSASKSSHFVLPLVTSLHPSTTILSKLSKEAFQDA